MEQVSSQNMQWEDFTESQKQSVLCVWTHKGEYDWYKRMWRHFEKCGLSLFSNDSEFNQVLTRFCVLAYMYKSFCRIGFAEIFELRDECTHWIDVLPFNHQMNNATLENCIFNELGGIVSATLAYYENHTQSRDGTWKLVRPDSRVRTSPEWDLQQDLFATTKQHPSLFATFDELIAREEQQKTSPFAVFKPWESELAVAALIANKFIY